MTYLQSIPAWSWYVAPAFLFLITVVVFFHELGHFSVARFFGVRVETFSIGFGRGLLKWRDKHGTQWKVGWIPLGGFVKFFGDADGASTPDREGVARMSAEDRAVAFPFKPLWQRALIVAAGPVANFILALVILTAMFMFNGHYVRPPLVTGVKAGFPAAAAGIRTGDRIVSIDGTAIASYEEIPQIVSLSAGQSLPVVLDRGGRQITVSVIPREVEVVDRFKNKMHVGQLGIENNVAPTHVYLGPIASVAAAGDEIRRIVTTTFRALFHSSTGVRQVSGFIGIGKVAGQVASVSFLGLIELAALLSVSIGLVNLFPIPLLDGGHLLYYACEGVLGRPLGERAQDVGFRLGLAVVLGMFLLATWNDLLNLF
ncbi:MAG: M50 family metallopeptidase [Rhizomicrobium sp.]